MGIFGPFYLKERRNTLKCYGVLFTSLVSPAINMEMTTEHGNRIIHTCFKIFYWKKRPCKVHQMSESKHLRGSRKRISQNSGRIEPQ